VITVRPHLLPATQDQRDSGLCGTAVGVKQVADDMWLVTFMHYDPEYFGDETCILEPVDNPFGLKRDLFLRPPPSG